MVYLKVYRGEQFCFRYENIGNVKVSVVTQEIVNIYNGILKVNRIVGEIEELTKHGVSLPPDMMGLTDEQIMELKLTDDWTKKYLNTFEHEINKDPVGRRTGFMPIGAKKTILLDAMKKAKEMVSAKTGETMTLKHVENALNELSGSVAISFPMGLPKYDPIYMELHNIEDLSGTQASLEVIPPSEAVLWFCGQQMADEPLGKFYGYNEKTTITVKLTRLSEGCPNKISGISEETKRMLMSQAYKRQEELKVSLNLIN